MPWGPFPGGRYDHGLGRTVAETVALAELGFAAENPTRQDVPRPGCAAVNALEPSQAPFGSGLIRAATDRN